MIVLCISRMTMKVMALGLTLSLSLCKARRVAFRSPPSNLGARRLRVAVSVYLMQRISVLL